MGRKKEKFDKDGPFQTRFRELNNQNGETQEALATEFDVTRSTVAAWIDGKSVPNILALEKIARHYGVSADYLLGLSDTATPDVTARAATEYTGLTPKAVERLHIGLDDFECDGEGISEEEKKQNLRTASALIRDKAFTDIVHRLSLVAEEAYMERILEILDSQYCVFDSQDEDEEFNFATETDRQIVESNMIYVLERTDPWLTETLQEKIQALDDEELSDIVVRRLIDVKGENERQQFHAAKAFTSYLDRLIFTKRQKAEERFETK